jgi:hypothetical protein
VPAGNSKAAAIPPADRVRHGTIGELLCESRLEGMGFDTYRNWKLKVSLGIDIIAYDPRHHYIYLIDNKAHGRTVGGDVSAFSSDRLAEENLERVRDLLDKHAGTPLSERAREAFRDATRVRFAVSNADPRGLNVDFSPEVYARGWFAFDLATGGIYSSAQEFKAARNALLGNGPKPTGTAGFATVGGMVFSLISVGGVVYALTQLDDLSDLPAFAVHNVVTGGAAIALGRLARMGPTAGGVIGVMLTLPDDSGGRSQGTSEEEIKEQLVSEFLASAFPPETIRERGEALRAEAREFLFNTRPLDVAPEPQRDGTRAADLAMDAIRLIDAHFESAAEAERDLLAAAQRHVDSSYKELLSTVFGVGVEDTARFVEMLKAKRNPAGGDYFDLLVAVLREEVGANASARIAEILLTRHEEALSRETSEGAGSSSAFDMEAYHQVQEGRDATEPQVEPGTGPLSNEALDQQRDATEPQVEPGTGPLSNEALDHYQTSSGPASGHGMQTPAVSMLADQPHAPAADELQTVSEQYAPASDELDVERASTEGEPEQPEEGPYSPASDELAVETQDGQEQIEYEQVEYEQVEYEQVEYEQVECQQVEYQG